MTACLPFGRNELKKHLPPSPCGRPVFIPTKSSEIDTRTIDQAVGGETDPNICVFSIGPHSQLSATEHLGAAWAGFLMSWSF